MFSSVYHGGGDSTTAVEYYLMFATFAIHGYLRQEESQYLAVPADKVKEYDRTTQKSIGYAISDPACGSAKELDPIYTLYPEELKNINPADF